MEPPLFSRKPLEGIVPHISTSHASESHASESLDQFPIFDIRPVSKEEKSTFVGQILHLFRKAVYREPKGVYRQHILTKVERAEVLEAVTRELAALKSETQGLINKYHSRAIGFVSRIVDKQLKSLESVITRLHSDGDVEVANVELLERYKNLTSVRHGFLTATLDMVRVAIQQDMMTLLGSQTDAMDRFENGEEQQQFIFSLERYLLPILDQFERLTAKEPEIHTLEALFLWKEGVDLKRHLLTNLGLLMIDSELDRLGRGTKRVYAFDEEAVLDVVSEQLLHLQETSDRLLQLLTLPSFAGEGDSFVKMLEQVKQDVKETHDYGEAEKRLEPLLQLIFETICHSKDVLPHSASKRRHSTDTTIN